VELIVVIAIIGILAAVLIPSISGYIDKAHRGRDVELAGHMTTEISLYATEYSLDLNNLTGTDVRTILLFSGQSLKPRKDNWVFVFDRTTHQVIVKDINEDGTILSIFNHNIIVDDEPESETFKPIDPTHIDNNYFLISKGNNNIEKAVDLMVNLKTMDDYEKAIGYLQGSKYLDFIERFNPSNTLFIGNGGVYTNATAKAINKIVMLEQTTNLPNLPVIEIDKSTKGTYLDLISDSYDYSTPISNTVRTSEPDSLLKTLFKGVVDIDFSKIKTIDLTAFGSKVDTTSIYKMEFGPYIKESFMQDITDEILSITLKPKPIEGNETQRIIINRKLTISYYNKDGLFARGSTIYAIIQDQPEPQHQPEPEPNI
jgi:type II secretory pathway pseudopilin PulG